MGSFTTTVPTTTLIEQEDGDKNTEKVKNTVKTYRADGTLYRRRWDPLAFSIFPGNQNEQTSLKPLEKKVIEEFGCESLSSVLMQALVLKITGS